MPNHVTAICTVTGPEIDVERFSGHLEKNDAGVTFDFEQIIPMPQVVLDTIRPSFDEPVPDGVPKESVGDGDVEFAARALISNGRTLLANEVSRELQSRYITQRPAALFWAKRLLRCAAETEYPGWYEWSVANWGTKWNSYALERRERTDGRLVFKFETAWSFPEPIFRKLAEMYPALVFEIAAYDEGDNFACTGSFNGPNDYECHEATVDLYERVYGHKREEE